MKGDSDIIKALQQCASGSDTDVSKCVDCPLFSDFMTCRQRLIKEANDLLKRIMGHKTKNENGVTENGNIS